MRFTTIIASASVAAVMGLAGVSVAGAVSSAGPAVTPTSVTPTSAAAPKTATPTAGPAQGGAAKAGAERAGAALRRRIRKGAGDIVTKTIGITRPELRQGLRAGKTIATIATEHGVQPQAVIDALKSAATAKIEAAQAAGKIKAARAAKLETRLDAAIPKLVNDWHPKAR